MRKTRGRKDKGAVPEGGRKPIPTVGAGRRGGKALAVEERSDQQDLFAKSAEARPEMVAAGREGGRRIALRKSPVPLFAANL
jgi:hypothetical protein